MNSPEHTSTLLFENLGINYGNTPQEPLRINFQDNPAEIQNQSGQQGQDRISTLSIDSPILDIPIRRHLDFNQQLNQKQVNSNHDNLRIFENFIIPSIQDKQDNITATNKKQLHDLINKFKCNEYLQRFELIKQTNKHMDVQNDYSVFPQDNILKYKNQGKYFNNTLDISDIFFRSSTKGHDLFCFDFNDSKSNKYDILQNRIEDQKTLDQKEMGNEIQTIKESFEDEVDKKFKFFQLSASKIITHQIFEFCTILVIVSNSIVLALEDPTNKNQTRWQELLDDIYLALYTLELILKILGMGFIFNKGAYLRDAWNILDFVIVSSGYFTLLFSNSSGSFSLSGLRAFRVLRPLRAVSSIEGLKILVQALLAALPLLRDTVIILMFFFLIFGIAGVQLFHGQLKKRCVFIETGKQHLDNLLCGGSQECPPGFFCGKRFESPNGDVTNFDNMLYAILTVFQSVTLEGWSYVMVDVQSVFGVFGILFFIPLVFIGAFFLLNLTLAVINSKFTEAHKRQTEKNKHNNSHKKFKKFLRGDPDLEIFNNHLSIRQFQIAQKTAKQMIKFLRDQQQRKNTEKEKQKLLRQKLNIIHPEQDSNSQQNKESSYFDDSISINNKQTITPKNGAVQLIKFNFGDHQITQFQNELIAKHEPQKQGQLKNNQNQFRTIIQSKQVEQEVVSGSYNIPKPIVKQQDSLNQSSIKTENIHKQQNILQNVISEDPEDEISVSLQSSIQNSDQDNQLIDDPNEIIRAIRSSQMNQSQNVESSNNINFRNIKMTGNWGLATQSIKNMETQKLQVKTLEANKDSDKVFQIRNEQHQEIDQLLPFDNIEILRPNVYQSEVGNKAESQMSREMLSSLEELKFSTQNSRKQIIIDQQAIDISDYENEKSIINSENSIQLQEYNLKKSNNFKLNTLEQDDRIVLSKQILIEPEVKRPSFRKQWTQIDVKQGQKNGQNLSEVKIRKSSTKLGQFIQTQSPIKESKSVDRQIRQYDIALNSSLGMSDQQKMSPDLKYKTQDNNFLEHKNSFTLNYIEKSKQTDLKQLNLQEKIGSKLKHNIVQQTLQQKTKKLQLAKNAQYKSTSLREVLEKRSPAKVSMITTNKKTKVQNNSPNHYYDSPYKIIEHKQNFKPYQQKSIYNIYSDEEDDYLFLDTQNIQDSQPYDTVTGIGYQEALQKLQTKQIARKSELVITSTLSFTYQPKEIPKKLRIGLNESKIMEDYVQNSAIKRSNSLSKIIDDSQNQVSNSKEEINHSFTQKIKPQINQFIQMTPQLTNLRRKPRGSIVATSLQRLLTKNQIQIGSGQNPNKTSTIYQRRKSVRNFNNQTPDPKSMIMFKSLFDSSRQKINKMKQMQKQLKVDGNNKKFTVKEAKKLFDGTFYSSEDEIVQPKNLYRSMHQKPGNSLSFDQDHSLLTEFEMDTQKQLENRNADRKLKENSFFKDSDKFNYCEVPQEVREELSLPEDVQGQDVDIMKIKKFEDLHKKKNKFWSGQDVLERKPGRKQLIDEERARWVISQLNSIRVWPRGFHGTFKKFRVFLKKIVLSNIFENFMLLSVLINTIVLSADRYNISQDEEATLITINNFFSALFIAEMCIKLFSNGVRKYLSDKLNYLDGIVVILSIVEIILNQSGNSSGTQKLSAFKTVRIFRTFRVLRVARLLRSLRSMQVIIGVIQRSVMSFVYIASLLLLFIFIFALLGMQIFGGQFKNHEFENSANYDTFHDAFITVFQVLTIENWQTILYESMNTNLGKIIPAIYYTTWIFMGNFILLNLFLAILLDSFIEEEEDKENQEFLDQEKHKAKTIQSKNQFQKSQKNLAIKAKQIQQNKARRKSVLKIFSESQNEIDIEDAQRNEEIEGIRDLEEMDEADIHKILIDNEIVQPSQSLKKDVKQTKLDLVRLFQYVYCQKSFYIFSRVIIQIHFQQFQQRNKFRIRLFRMTKHRYFERLILFIIVLSSIKLAIDTYLLDYPSDSEIVNILVYESYFQIQLSNYIDILFTFLFTVECIIKSICLGFVQDKGSYLRETWNILDFFIVISSLIDLALVEIDIPFIKILRLLRTLRPLRFISHNIQMKTVVVALFESIGHIFNVMIVVMIVWLMFAILGVNLFSGKFFYCTIDTFQTSTMKECYDKKGKWLIYDHNFDNVGNAMITLFAVSTLEDWPQIMYQAVNVNDENRGPIINNIPANAYFFVIFIFIGSYFLLNFFIGVLFLKYNEAQKAETKGFTQEHLQWLDMQRMIINTKPDFETTNIPKQTWRKRIHRLVGLPQFDVLIMICIILNMIQMACLFEGTSPGYREILDQLNVVFSLIFLIEAILKIIAYGFSYFENSWNKFDFIIVLTSLIDLALSLLSTNSLKFLRVGPQLARVLRVARVTRVIRLVGKYQGLQALIQTITFSLPSLLNVLGLLLLVFFMFSVLGVFFFKEIKTGVIINEYMNFKNFGNAILILFRMSTGEDWNFIMFDCAREPSDGCIEGLNCGNKIISYIYFISFIMICTNIMLNLFVLVIIQQFDKYYLPQNNIISLFKQDLIGFKDTWKNFTMDKYNCKKIKESQLTQFFQELKAPLGMPNIKDQDLKKNMLKMGIKSDITGYIYFNELLYRCMKRIYGQLKLNKQMQINELKTQYKLIQRSISESQSMRMFKNRDILELMTSKSNSVNPFLSVMFFKMSFKRWLNYTSLNKKRRRKLRRFQKYSNQQLTFAQMEIYKKQIHEFEQKKNEDDKQGQLEFDYEEDEEVLILYPQSDDEKNSLSNCKSVSSDSSFSDSDLDRDVPNSNKSKKSSSKSRITKKITIGKLNQSKNREVLEDSESNDTINQSQDNSFRHLVDQNTDRINLKGNFRKKLSIKNENISTSDFDRNSIILVGNILKNSLQNQPGENIKIKVKKRSRKNFDTIEEEDEIYSLPSLPKKKRSSKQFQFL